MSHIAKVGFELEGGWNGERGISPFKDISLTEDGSINGQQLHNDTPIRPVHAGEAVSPPIEYEPFLPDGPLPKWVVWLREHWPNAPEGDRTNRTCGYHIHVSFPSHLDYSLLTSKAYLFSLRREMLGAAEAMGLLNFPNLVDRLQGKNYFATIHFDAARQMQLNIKRGIHTLRYGYLNFAWGVHGTMEFRALPTFFNPEDGVGMTKVFFTHLDHWLDTTSTVNFLEKELSI